MADVRSKARNSTRGLERIGDLATGVSIRLGLKTFDRLWRGVCKKKLCFIHIRVENTGEDVISSMRLTRFGDLH